MITLRRFSKKVGVVALGAALVTLSHQNADAGTITLTALQIDNAGWTFVNVTGGTVTGTTQPNPGGFVSNTFSTTAEYNGPLTVHWSASTNITATQGDQFGFTIFNSNASAWNFTLAVVTNAGTYSTAATTANNTFIDLLTGPFGVGVTEIQEIQIGVNDVVPVGTNDPPDDYSVNFQVYSVDEQSSISLLVVGLILLAGIYRRQ